MNSPLLVTICSVIWIPLRFILNIKTILEEVGSGLDKIVKTTVFMVAGNDFAMLNKVYAEVFPAYAPARSTPQVMPFPGGILVSIECIALL